MTTTPTAGRRRWPVLLAGIVLLVLLFFAALPLLVEQFIARSLQDRPGFADYRVAVSHFGPFGAVFHVSSGSTAAVVAGGTVRAEWTLPSLLERRLDALVLDGLLLHLPAAGPESRQSPSKASSFVPPILVDELRVSNSVLVLRMEDRIIHVPVSLSATRTQQGVGSDPLISYRVGYDLVGQAGTADLSYDPEHGILAGQLTAGLHLDTVPPYIPAADRAGIEVTGRAELKAVFGVGLFPFRVREVQAELRVPGLDLAGPQVRLQADGTKETMLTLVGGNEGYRLTCDGMALVEPVPALFDCSAALQVTGNQMAWQGDMQVMVGAADLAGERLGQESRVPLLLHHEGTLADGLLAVRFSAGSEKREGSGPITLRLGEQTLHAGGLEINGELSMSIGGQQGERTGHIAAGVRALELVAADGTRFTAPALDLRGALTTVADEGQGKTGLAGSLVLVDGSLALPREAGLQGIRIALPFAWPLGEVAGPGEFTVDRIAYQGTGLGSLSGALVQQGSGLTLSGEFVTGLVPASSISLEGDVRFSEEEGLGATGVFTLRDGQVDTAKLAPFVPQFKAISGTAMLNLSGTLSYDRCGLDGTLAADLVKGNFKVPAVSMDLEDVIMAVRIPSLARLETEPEQKVSIATIRSNKLVAHDMKATFRIESPRSLFIEKIGAKWSGGRVFTSSFRLQGGGSELELALFCDRLQLAGILSQFGLASAEGEGRLSGRIPLVYRDNSVFVDDGFLFTSPGEKGTLKVQSSKHLTVGIPVDVPQFSPLHFAGAALSDFEYNWAKLNIVSEGENLLLKLQIDGKPREKLPYRFDAASNLFVRLPEGAQGGLDQPVKLDVNFNVPLNELLKYQQSIQPLLRQIN